VKQGIRQNRQKGEQGGEPQSRGFVRQPRDGRKTQLLDSLDAFEPAVGVGAADVDQNKNGPDGKKKESGLHHHHGEGGMGIALQLVGQADLSGIELDDATKQATGLSI